MQTTVEKVYSPEEKVIILGGGPSLKKVDLESIKHYPIIGCNCAFFLGGWVDLCFFGDCRFYNWYQDDIEKWTNPFYTCCANLKDHPTIYWLKRKDDRAFSPNPSAIGWPTGKGGNTGAAAINLAYHLGARNIILLGFDGEAKKGVHNYHSYYIKHHTPADHVYQKYDKHFRKLAEALPEDVHVVNCTPETKLKVFPRKPLEKIL